MEVSNRVVNGDNTISTWLDLDLCIRWQGISLRLQCWWNISPRLLHPSGHHVHLSIP